MVAPFFIIGFQRSGTTLLRVMLDAHPNIAIPLDTVGLWNRYERKLENYDGLATAAGRSRIISDLLAERESSSGRPASRKTPSPCSGATRPTRV